MPLQDEPDEAAEFRQDAHAARRWAHHHRPRRCSDGMCGAEDCPRCGGSPPDDCDDRHPFDLEA